MRDRPARIRAELLIIGAFIALAVIGAIAYVIQSGGPDQYPGVLP